MLLEPPCPRCPLPPRLRQDSKTSHTSHVMPTPCRSARFIFFGRMVLVCVWPHSQQSRAQDRSWRHMNTHHTCRAPVGGCVCAWCCRPCGPCCIKSFSCRLHLRQPQAACTTQHQLPVRAGTAEHTTSSRECAATPPRRPSPAPVLSVLRCMLHHPGHDSSRLAPQQLSAQAALQAASGSAQISCPLSLPGPHSTHCRTIVAAVQYDAGSMMSALTPI
jgi:hypothetical protein